MELGWDGKFHKVEVIVLETGEFMPLDAIFYKSEWWLVLTWLLKDSTQHKIPERIVRLARFHCEDHHNPRFRFLVNTPVPRSFLGGSSHSGPDVELFPSILYTQGPSDSH